MASNEKISSATCDRKEFLGRNGSLESPAALRRVSLAGRDGAGLDPCAAIQVTVELAPHEAREIVFLLGEGDSKKKLEQIVAKYSTSLERQRGIRGCASYWDEMLGTVEIKTPDLAMDTMLNRWLLYQTLGLPSLGALGVLPVRRRFWFPRSVAGRDGPGLQQTGHLSREQILRAAAHQFKEGDVQHWWHPPTGRGVRTRFLRRSALAAFCYVRSTSMSPVTCPFSTK